MWLKYSSRKKKLKLKIISKLQEDKNEKTILLSKEMNGSTELVKEAIKENQPPTNFIKL